MDQVVLLQTLEDAIDAHGVNLLTGCVQEILDFVWRKGRLGFLEQFEHLAARLGDAVSPAFEDAKGVLGVGHASSPFERFALQYSRVRGWEGA